MQSEPYNENFQLFVNSFFEFVTQIDPSLKYFTSSTQTAESRQLVFMFWNKVVNISKTPIPHPKISVNFPHIVIQKTDILPNSFNYSIYLTKESLSMDLFSLSSNSIGDNLDLNDLILPGDSNFQKISLKTKIAIKCYLESHNVISYFKEKFQIHLIGNSQPQYIQYLLKWFKINLPMYDVDIDFQVFGLNEKESICFINFGAFYFIYLENLLLNIETFYFNQIVTQNLIFTLDKFLFDLDDVVVVDYIRLLRQFKAHVMAKAMSLCLIPLSSTKFSLSNLQSSEFHILDHQYLHKGNKQNLLQEVLLTHKNGSLEHNMKNSLMRNNSDYYNNFPRILSIYMNSKKSNQLRFNDLQFISKAIYLQQNHKIYADTLLKLYNPVNVLDCFTCFLFPRKPHCIKESFLKRLLVFMRSQIDIEDAEHKWWEQKKYIKLFLVLSVLESVKEFFIPYQTEFKWIEEPQNSLEKENHWIRLCVPFRHFLSINNISDDLHDKNLYNASKCVYEYFQKYCLNFTNFMECKKSTTNLNDILKVASDHLASSGIKDGLEMLKEETVASEIDFALFNLSMDKYTPVFNCDKELTCGFTMKSNDFLSYLIENQANQLCKSLHLIDFCYSPDKYEKLTTIFTPTVLQNFNDIETDSMYSSSGSDMTYSSSCSDSEMSEIMSDYANIPFDQKIPITEYYVFHKSSRKRQREDGFVHTKDGKKRKISSNSVKNFDSTSARVKRTILTEINSKKQPQSFTNPFGVNSVPEELGSEEGENLNLKNILNRKTYKKIRLQNTFTSFISSFTRNMNLHVFGHYSTNHENTSMFDVNCDLVSTLYELILDNILPDELTRELLFNITLEENLVSKESKNVNNNDTTGESFNEAFLTKEVPNNQSRQNTSESSSNCNTDMEFTYEIQEILLNNPSYCSRQLIAKNLSEYSHNSDQEMNTSILSRHFQTIQQIDKNIGSFCDFEVFNINHSQTTKNYRAESNFFASFMDFISILSHSTNEFNKTLSRYCEPNFLTQIYNKNQPEILSPTGCSFKSISGVIESVLMEMPQILLNEEQINTTTATTRAIDTTPIDVVIRRNLSYGVLQDDFVKLEIELKKDISFSEKKSYEIDEDDFDQSDIEEGIFLEDEKNNYNNLEDDSHYQEQNNVNNTQNVNSGKSDNNDAKKRVLRFQATDINTLFIKSPTNIIRTRSAHEKLPKKDFKYPVIITNLSNINTESIKLGLWVTKFIISDLYSIFQSFILKKNDIFV